MAKEKPQPLQVSSARHQRHAESRFRRKHFGRAGDRREKPNRTALVQEIQHSPVGGAILHIDFHAVSMDEKIHADVPLEPVGIANGVKNFGGLLEQNLRSLPIECLPRDLPDRGHGGCFRAEYWRYHSRSRYSAAAGVTTKVQPDLTAFSVARTDGGRRAGRRGSGRCRSWAGSDHARRKEEGETPGAAPASQGQRSCRRKKSRRSNRDWQFARSDLRSCRPPTHAEGSHDRSANSAWWRVSEIPGAEYEHTRHNIGFMVVDSPCLAVGSQPGRSQQSGTLFGHR